MAGEITKSNRPMIALPTEAQLAIIDAAVEKLNQGEFRVNRMSRARFLLAAALFAAAKVEAGENPFNHEGKGEL